MKCHEFHNKMSRKFDKLVRFIQCFPNTSFTKQVFGVTLIFYKESFLGRIGQQAPSIYYGFIV